MTSETARKEMPRCGLRPGYMVKRYGGFRILNRHDGTHHQENENTSILRLPSRRFEG